MREAPLQTIAVIGSGIAGLSAAYALQQAGRSVTLIEAEAHFGGHAHTVDVAVGEDSLAVDTGFIVYNTRTYPNFIRLLSELDVATDVSDMSFAVSLKEGALEYRSDRRLSLLLAQKRNLLRPQFWAMGRDLLRFYRAGPGLAARSDLDDKTLGDLAEELGLSAAFLDWHLLPMAAAIWSTSCARIRAFPAGTFVRFFENHGLFLLNERPQWRTVRGGSRTYVKALLQRLGGEQLLGCPVHTVAGASNGVTLTLADGIVRRFDAAVLAVHGEAAHQLTSGAYPALSAIRTTANRVVLHQDSALMPKRRALWSSWNYVESGIHQPDAPAPITYWMNRLQHLDTKTDIFISLNPQRAIDPNRILREFICRHPVFDAPAQEAKARIQADQGRNRLWFAGAWLGNGFHEDGCTAGLAAARALLGQAP